jgi:hypothetical protein
MSYLFGYDSEEERLVRRHHHAIVKTENDVSSTLVTDNCTDSDRKPFVE